MGYVGIDSTGARQLAQVMKGTSIGAGRMRQQIVGALAVAQLDSVAPGLLARVEDGLAELGETVTGRAAAADLPTDRPAERIPARYSGRAEPAGAGAAAGRGAVVGVAEPDRSIIRLRSFERSMPPPARLSTAERGKCRRRQN